MRCSESNIRCFFGDKEVVVEDCNINLEGGNIETIETSDIKADNKEELIKELDNRISKVKNGDTFYIHDDCGYIKLRKGSER